MLVTEALTKCYGDHVALDQLSISVGEGEIFGFLGPNGAGKTTAIRVLLGFLRADGGKARLFGRDAWRDGKSIREQTGYLPGDLRLPQWMRGSDALRFAARVRRQASLFERGRELAERFRLDLDVRVRDQSRGMRQKLGILLACAHEPRLLILDEPTTALDPVTQDSLLEYLRQVAESGRTVFFSSHVLSEVDSLCERVAILRQGKLVESSSLDELRARASRQVEIVFRDERAASVAVPDCLHVTQSEERSWRGTLNGPPADLIEWLGGRGIVDVVVRPPDLDRLFLEYY